MDDLRAGEGKMSGDPYNLRIGIRPEELEDYPWRLPYISVFAITHEAISSSSWIMGTGMPQWYTQEQVDAIQDSNARARAMREK